MSAVRVVDMSTATANEYHTLVPHPGRILAVSRLKLHGLRPCLALSRQSSSTDMASIGERSPTRDVTAMTHCETWATMVSMSPRSCNGRDLCDAEKAKPLVAEKVSGMEPPVPHEEEAAQLWRLTPIAVAATR